MFSKATRVRAEEGAVAAEVPMALPETEIERLTVELTQIRDAAEPVRKRLAEVRGRLSGHARPACRPANVVSGEVTATEMLEKYENYARSRQEAEGLVSLLEGLAAEYDSLEEQKTRHRTMVAGQARELARQLDGIYQQIEALRSDRWRNKASREQEATLFGQAEALEALLYRRSASIRPSKSRPKGGA